MCHISRAGRGRSVSVLWCGNGSGLTVREGTALCAATHHFSLSRMKSTSLSVFSSEMQPDEKFRSFCVSKWPQEPGEQPVYKESSKWHFPSWLWMCLTPFSWSGLGRRTAWCLISTIAQCTLQTKPAWPCPPNTTIPWVLPQVMLATSLKKLPTWAMSWIIVNSDIHQTQQIITFTETFPFYWSSTLQLSKVTAASGGRWEMCLLEMLVLSNSPAV